MSEELKRKVLEEKYMLRDDNGKLIETTEEQIWSRVSTAVASVENNLNKKKWQKQFYWLLENWKFVPGGRIMFGAGNTDRKITNLNCYFMPLTGDSIEGIYKCMSETAKTLAYGGGVGIDVSILRPRKALVRNSAMYSSGVVSVAELFSHTSGLIGQHGRIGAMIITLHCNHPDILDFIRCKDDATRSKIKYANMSVLVTDKLMEAVQNDGDFELWYPEITSDAPDEIQELVEEIGKELFPKDKDVGTLDGMLPWKNPELLEKVKQKFIEHDIVFIYNGHEQFYNYDNKEWFVFYCSASNEFEIRKRKQYAILKANTLWNELIGHARDSAEPGVIFYDVFRKNSTTEYDGMYVVGPNPCAETCLSAYGCCCLGSINLSSVVSHEFTNDAAIDYNLLEQLVRTGVRFLDNVLDYNKGKHPLIQQDLEAQRSRRIGLGVTGLADMLCKLKLKYDTAEAVETVDKLFSFIKKTAYSKSAKLAAEKGSFTGFNKSKHFMQRFYENDEEIRQYEGLRNGALLSIPPVGSGSLLTQTSSGIEPIFSISYNRKSESLSQSEFKIYHPLANEYMRRHGLNKETDLPEFFVTADRIDHKVRVQMQSTIQKHVCQAISSTVNLPNDIAVEVVKQIYFNAWLAKCKGITVYRQGSRGDILTATPVVKKPRTPVTEGKTIKVKYRDERSIYVTLNYDEGKHPSEVFVNLGKSGSDAKATAEALGRLISLYLQSNGDIKRVIETLIDIKGESVHWWDGMSVFSLPDATAKALLKLADVSINLMAQCTKCKAFAMKYEGGCYVCTDCGESKCG